MAGDSPRPRRDQGTNTDAPMTNEDSDMFYLERKNRRLIRTSVVEKLKEVVEVAKTIPPQADTVPPPSVH
jgi:hypothetical protein